jgi:hypothetical protein
VEGWSSNSLGGLGGLRTGRKKRRRTTKQSPGPVPSFSGGHHEVDRLREQAYRRLRVNKSVVKKKLYVFSVSSPSAFLKWFENIAGAESETKYSKTGTIQERVILRTYGDVAKLLRLGAAGLEAKGAAVIKTRRPLTGCFVVPPLILDCRSRERQKGDTGLSGCTVSRAHVHRKLPADLARPQVHVRMNTATVQPGLGGLGLHMSPGLDAVADSESQFSGLFNVRAAFAAALPDFLARASQMGDDTATK